MWFLETTLTVVSQRRAAPARIHGILMCQTSTFLQGCLNPGLPYQPCGGNVGGRSRQYGRLSESLELAVGERLCPAYTLEAASPGGWSQVDIQMMQDGGTSRFLNSQPSGPRSWLEVSGMAEGDGDEKA